MAWLGADRVVVVPVTSHDELVGYAVLAFANSGRGPTA